MKVKETKLTRKLQRTSDRLRRRLDNARATREHEEAVADLRKKIRRWGWYPAVRWAAKNGVPIEVAVDAHARQDNLDFTQ